MNTNVKSFILLVVVGGLEGGRVQEHDRASSPEVLQKRASFRGCKPLRLKAEDVAYVFPEGGTHPVLIGMGSNARGAGAPSWSRAK